ncbi:MAG: tyrosine recombinase XerC [Clostridiales bacterium]|jgi:site-specific recombinase XerD|nr:tyrosine recombinase XerC [Clostridiales bacterium]
MKKSDFNALPPLLIEFLRYVGSIKNMSNSTVSEYAFDLRTFIRFVKAYRDDNVSIDEGLDSIDIRDCDIDFFKSITLSDAYAFLSYCKDERDNSAKTRARKVASIRAFYKYLHISKKLISENPMAELDSPKINKSLPKYLTLDQSMELLSSIDGKNKERNFCIITLFLNCGLRLSELVSLNYTDIRSDNTLRVTGKGSKERTVYLNNACIEAIKDYMRVRPKDGVIDKEALFLSNRLKRISPKTVQYVVKTFIEKSGLGGLGFSVHKLRHTAATLMYQYGDVDILVLKEILGHDNIATTEIYTHVVDKHIREAANANPLSDFDKTKVKKKR